MSDEPLWTPEETAQYLGITKRVLADWRHKKRGPRWIKLSPGRSGRIRYDRESVLEWKAGHERS